MTAGVYLIRADNGLTKIGQSSNVEQRFQALRTMSPLALTLALVIETEYRLTAERALHQHFDHQRRDGEWFHLSPDDVLWVRDWEPEVPPAPEVRRAGITCRLSRLLGDRRMSVAELQRQTGLSYVTLHSLYRDKSTRIDFETLNKICRALDVVPGDILEYEPDSRATQVARRPQESEGE